MTALERISKELKEPYRSLAIKYAERGPAFNCETAMDCSKLGSAITSAFVWSDTDEGEAFWSKVSDAADWDGEYPEIKIGTKPKKTNKY
jgi:hypothetical protein